MTYLLYVLGVLALAVGVAVSIALHEIGHLLPAKRFGVKVTQYMVGFGPTVWSRRRGETEYGIKAVPLGGYIRMIGMFPPKPGDDPSTMRVSSTGRFSQLIDEARRTSLEEVQPGDDKRVFYRLSTLKKVTVMLGGPMMNLVIAVACLGGLVTLYGMPVEQKGSVVAAVYECVAPVSTTAAPPATCSSSQPKTPAYKAGLRPGDRFVSINGSPVDSSSAVGDLIGPRSEQATTVVVDRDGHRLTLEVTPIRSSLPIYDKNGKPVLGADGKATYHETGFLGISSATPVAVERQPVTAVPGVVWNGLTATAGVVLRIPQKMVGVAKAAFGDGARDANGPISVVGVGRIAGEVSSGQLSILGNDTGAKIAMLVQLLASLNLALFVFNLIPLLPLDGGHVAGALWEAVKRGLAKLRHRPDPGYVDVAKALPLAYAVSLGLLVMSVLLIYADIVNPVKLGS